MKVCITCGMPLEDSKLIGGEVDEGPVCMHCFSEDGKIKSCDEIFEGGVQFFIGAVPGTDKEFAEKLVRKNMNRLEYWQKNRCECLDGDQATDEEFSEAMNKMSQFKH